MDFRSASVQFCALLAFAACEADIPNHHHKRWRSHLHQIGHGGAPSNADAFIAMATPAALAIKATWGTPASVLIAQSALETGWGQHVRNGSYFGIKAGSRYAGASTNFATHEVVGGKSFAYRDNFRAYDSFAEAADGYGQFLTNNPLFSGAFVFKDEPLKFLSTIAKHYATKPNYEETVRSIIRHHNLLTLDAPSPGSRAQ